MSWYTYQMDIRKLNWKRLSFISVRWLDHGNWTVVFKDGTCTIKNPTGCIMAMIPHSNGLYWIPLSNSQPNLEYTAVATAKININLAHRKFCHITHATIKHAMSKGFILGIELDMNSKPEFCEACTKAKSTTLPFLKQSLTRSYKVWWTGTLGPVRTSIS